MANFTRVTGKRRQRLMLVSAGLLIVSILMLGISLVAPIALAQGYDDWDSSSPGCCCCCAAAILPLACVGLTYSFRADNQIKQ